MNGNGDSGKAWEWFWRFLSLIAIPWAVWISLTMQELSGSARELKTQIDLEHEEVERRLTAIEKGVDPSNRFYRRDGDALERRVLELEGLHPRTKTD